MAPPCVLLPGTGTLLLPVGPGTLGWGGRTPGDSRDTGVALMLLSSPPATPPRNIRRGRYDPAQQGV